MIRKALGTVIRSTTVAATTNRTRGRLSARNWTTAPPSRAITIARPIVRTAPSGMTTARTLPGTVSRSQVRPTTVIYLSTPPMIGSSEAMIAIVSAIRLPGMSRPTDWRWMKLGSWMRIR